MSRHASINPSTAAKLCDKIAKLGVEPPAAIRKALAAIDEATTYVESRTVPDVLNMDPAELGKFILEASVTRHKGVPGNDGFQAGVDAVQEAAAQQARAAALPELEQVIEDLRPRLDKLVTPLVSAVREYDFTLSTTSDEVINLEDEGASQRAQSMGRDQPICGAPNEHK